MYINANKNKQINVYIHNMQYIYIYLKYNLIERIIEYAMYA